MDWFLQTRHFSSLTPLPFQASLSLPLPPSSSLAQPFPKPLHGGLLGALSSTPAGTSAQLATLNKPNSFSRPCSSAPSLPSTITLGNSKKKGSGICHSCVGVHFRMCSSDWSIEDGHPNSPWDIKGPVSSLRNFKDQLLPCLFKITA